ncbi:MAG: PIN domain-containing protein [Caldilineales bacterium]|nr:PIN domain-containing protein [Caldilineales bacterium]MCW5859902.1 PIN domain-containing protein [Caldilineales bacterium]
MRSFVVDTHPLVWHLTADTRLGPQGSDLFQATDRGDVRLIVPGIVLIEIIYLAEKRRLPANLVSQVTALLEPPTINYQLAPLDLPVIKRLETVDRSFVPDLPDRIVVATALRWDLPLISRDAAFSRVAELNLVW